MQSGAKMPYRRLPVRDPRTVARNIPGLSDVLYPQLTPGLVSYLNKQIGSCVGVEPVPAELLEASTLNRAMLFEVALARGQEIVGGETSADWDSCLRIATSRQRRHFDARVPKALQIADTVVADWVGYNLSSMLNHVHRQESDVELVHGPSIPGFQWMASTEGDFSVGAKLIEVKCTNRKFGVADYRQILMYWLLSYAASVERDSREWSSAVLLNPRLNHMMEFTFDDLIGLMAAGRSKVELLEMFSFVVGEYGLKAVSNVEL